LSTSQQPRPDWGQLPHSPWPLAASAGQGKPGHPPRARPRRGACRLASGGRAFAYGARSGSARRNNMQQLPCGPITRRDTHRGQVVYRPGGRPGRGPGGGNCGQHRLALGTWDLPSKEGVRAGAGGVAVLARYSWAHLHAQHWLWNQAAGQGLDSVLFWSCPG